MKNILGKYYRNTIIGYYLIHPFYLIYELILKSIPNDVFVRSKFKRKMGYRLNLKNPKTFNEKINWL